MTLSKSIQKALNPAVAAFGAIALAVTGCDTDAKHDHAFLEKALVSPDGVVTLITENAKTHAFDTASYQIVSDRYEQNFDDMASDIAYLQIVKDPRGDNLNEHTAISVLSHKHINNMAVGHRLDVDSEDSVAVLKLNQDMLEFASDANQKNHQNYVGGAKHATAIATHFFNGFYVKNLRPQRVHTVD